AHDGIAHAAQGVPRFLDRRLPGLRRLEKEEKTMNVQPYLSFEGRAQEAIDFYKSALGAQVEAVMQFKDAPPDMQANMPNKDKVMHASFKVGDTTIYASDGNCGGSPKFEGITLTINATSNNEAEKLVSAHGQGGQVQMPR